MTNGTQSDVAAKIAGAADGDIVKIPAGSFTWTSGVSISGKGIRLQGAGSGRIIGQSLTPVPIGTGLKTFTTTKLGLPVSAGQVLRIERTGGTSDFMQGTVVSYIANILIMNITSSAGSGTKSFWIISTTASTTITHNAGSATLISLTEDASHTVAVSDLQIITGSGSGNHIAFATVTNGKPVQVLDCWFRSTAASTNSIYTTANRGIIYNCSFDSSPFSMAPLAIHQKGGPTSSWTTPSTMGMADTGGINNLYVENCDFHAWLNACDMDDCGRSVWRYNLMNNAGFGTHGADTSNYGVRHYEIYNCEFLFNNVTGQAFNLNWWFFLRGGTGVIADNILPDLNSQDYGNKAEISATVMNLQRNGGPNSCWGANITGAQYPAPRQVGMGYVSGTAGNDSITYKGDSEPLYIWGNSRTPVVALSDYGGTSCASPDTTASYIVANRDYVNTGAAKPGYTKYTYPHPLRVSSSNPNTPPSAAVIGIEIR